MPPTWPSFRGRWSGRLNLLGVQRVSWRETLVSVGLHRMPEQVSCCSGPGRLALGWLLSLLRLAVL